MEKCRICLKKSTNHLEFTESYYEKFYAITNIEFDPQYNEFICKSCLGRLLYSHKFRIEALEAHEIFKNERMVIEDKPEAGELEMEDEMIVEETYAEYLEDESFDQMEENVETQQEPSEIYTEFENEEYLMLEDDISNQDEKIKLILIKQDTSERKPETGSRSKNNPTKCEYCNKTYKNIAALTMHLRTHTDDRPFVCTEPSCGARFKQITNLNQHTKTVHANENPFVCHICELALPLASALKVHLMTKHDRNYDDEDDEDLPNKSRKWSCPECPREFDYPSQLREHMASHLGEKKFQCKICEKAYYKTCNLRRHYKTSHLDEYKQMLERGEFKKVKGDDDIEILETIYQRKSSIPKLKCNECNLLFNKNKALMEHIQDVHGDEKLFNCADCSSTFVSTEDLQKHLKNHHHQKQNDLVCQTCYREFPYPSLLKQHIESHHDNIKVLCDVCSKTYSRMSHLLRHYRYAHKDYYDEMVAEGKIKPRKSRKVMKLEEDDDEQEYVEEIVE